MPIRVRYYGSPEKLNAAWMQKKMDVVTREMPPAELAKYSPSDTTVRVTENEGADVRNLVFNVRKGSPVAKTAVRQAIANVIDRPALVRDVHHRTVEPLYSLIPQGITAHSTAFFDAYPKPDAARARQVLVAAGVKLPVKFDLAYSQGAATDEEAATIRDQLQRTGLFKVKIKKYPWTEFQKGYAAGKFAAYAVGWVPDFPDPDTFTTPLVGAASTLQNGYVNKGIDKLILGTQRNSDRGRTAVDFRKLQTIVAEDVPLLPLWQKTDVVLSSEDIKGTQYLSDGTGVWRLWELGWI